MFHIACCVNAGIGGYKNDDRALVNTVVIRDGCYEQTSETAFALICDGVGGEAFGDEAAEIAAGYFASLTEAPDTGERVQSCIREANALILQAKQCDKSHYQMATTITGIYLTDEDMLGFNIGDSRIYRYRPPYIAQMSTDHSLVAETKALGLMPTAVQAHVITRCLDGRSCAPDIIQSAALACDTYFLCSDGISDVINDLELEAILTMELPPQELCQFLVDTAIKKGSTDNLSAILIRRA